MRFFVRYSTAQYEGESEEVFSTVDEVLAFLNKHAANPDFRFQVIEGRLVEFEPITVAKAYRRK